MSPYLLAGLIAGLPLLLVLIFRVHASAFFIGVTSGYLLTQFVGDTTGLITGSFVKADNSGQLASLVVFVLPIIFIIWLMRGSLPGRQLPMHIFPNIGIALMFFVFVLPLLNEGLRADLNTTQIGVGINRAGDLIILVAVLMQLILMFLTAKPAKGKHHK